MRYEIRQNHVEKKENEKANPEIDENILPPSLDIRLYQPKQKSFSYDYHKLLITGV